MTIRHLTDTVKELEDWHKAAKESYFTNTGASTRMQKDYIDKITGNQEDTLIKLSTDSKIHTDRIFYITIHPDYPTTDIGVITYDDSDILNDKSITYPTTQQWRDDNRGSGLTEISTEDLQALGFVSLDSVDLFTRHEEEDGL